MTTDCETEFEQNTCKEQGTAAEIGCSARFLSGKRAQRSFESAESGQVIIESRNL